MTTTTTPSRAAALAAAALAACLLALGAPLSAAAATTAGENTPLNLGSTPTAPHASSSGGASLVRTIVGLAIVIAVIWGLSWILRQVKAGRDPHAPSTGLASVAALTLGNGRSVHLVRAGNDYVLLGSAEHGIVPIHRYTQEQAIEAGLPTLAEAPARASRRALLSPPSSPSASSPRASAHRHADPMRMPSPGSELVARLRELTVRR